MKPLCLPFVLFVLVAGCFSDPEVGPGLPDGLHQPPSLRRTAQERGFLVGAAVNPARLSEAPYAATLAREFNALTAENVLKFGPLRPSEGRYEFDAADRLVRFAEENDMHVRGHTLVWYMQVPDWLRARTWTRDALLGVMHDHIQTVVGRYRGRIHTWDVVNEALMGDGSYRDSLWHRIIGPEYIDKAFRWAHEADPQARLFYNDYGAEAVNKKSDAVYRLVSGMLERGVPIHGVGLQMHVSTESYPSPESIRSNIRRLAALGLAVHITELDVRIPEPATAEKLALQAQVYRNIAGACLAEPGCEAIVTWGFTDRYSWVPSFFKGYGSALPFDADYRPKPAYDALAQTLGAYRK